MGDTPEWVTRVQTELGAVISHPKLAEKFLMKPPVRFLHDIVTSFIKTANFPLNYYSEDMLDSSKLTEKEAKLEFLTKLVTVVQIATGKTTTCKPAKTLAGQEPEGTCDLLCLLAACNKLSQADKDKAVKKALGGGEAEAEPSAAAAPQPKKDDGAAAAAAAAEKEREREERKERERKERKERERAESAQKEASAASEAGTSRRDRKSSNNKDEDRERAATPTEEEEGEGNKEKDKRRSGKGSSSKDKDKKGEGSSAPAEVPKLGAGAVERPSTATARKPPPPVRSNEMHEERIENPKEVATVIREEKRGKGRDEKEEVPDWEKLVEEHAAARANVHANADEAAGYLGREAIEARKRQEAIKKEDDDANKVTHGTGLVIKSSINKDKIGSAVGDSELSRLREQLQMLTKATNPLGKFLEAIHEDIDTMSRELEMWRTEARTQAAAALEAQRQTEESLHNVQAKIQNVEDAIGDQLNRTNILRATILNNDKTIDTLIRMVVNPDTGLTKKK